MEAGLNGSFMSNADHKLSSLKGQQYAEKDDVDFNVCRIKLNYCAIASYEQLFCFFSLRTLMTVFCA